MNIEQFKIKNASQLAELGKKGDAINRLKIELGGPADRLLGAWWGRIDDHTVIDLDRLLKLPIRKFRLRCAADRFIRSPRRPARAARAAHRGRAPLQS